MWSNNEDIDTKHSVQDVEVSDNLFEIDINLRKVKTDYPTQDTKFLKQELEEASSMVIVPAYVRWDEEFIPDFKIKGKSSFKNLNFHRSVLE